MHIMTVISSHKLYSELKQTHINIGTGIDLSIKELAELVKEIVGFKGNIEWDYSKPDGTAKKQLDVTLLNKLNWKFKITMRNGIHNFLIN